MGGPGWNLPLRGTLSRPRAGSGGPSDVNDPTYRRREGHNDTSKRDTPHYLTSKLDSAVAPVRALRAMTRHVPVSSLSASGIAPVAQPSRSITFCV